MKTKPITQMKLGIWENRIKLRRIIDKISMYYGMILLGMGIFITITGYKLEGILLIILSFPLLIIQISHYKYQRSKYEQKQNTRKTK